MNLGDKIKNLRTQQKMTQEQLAEKLFVSRTAVSKWERNLGYPNIDSLKLLSEVFGVTLDELLSNEQIIEIAKEEKQVTIDKFNDLFVAIINLSAILLIVLPIYKLVESNFVRSVSIFVCDMFMFTKIFFTVIICTLFLCGAMQLALYFLKTKKADKILKRSSISLHIILAVLLIAVLEPYAAVLSFVLLGLRIGLIIKFNTIKS